MKLTNEQIKRALVNVRGGCNGIYYHSDGTHMTDDLREILELRQRIVELESILTQLNSSTNLEELRTAMNRNVELFSRTGE